MFHRLGSEFLQPLWGHRLEVREGKTHALNRHNDCEELSVVCGEVGIPGKENPRYQAMVGGRNSAKSSS
jgi:hypothetical protein